MYLVLTYYITYGLQLNYENIQVHVLSTYIPQYYVTLYMIQYLSTYISQYYVTLYMIQYLSTYIPQYYGTLYMIQYLSTYIPQYYVTDAIQNIQAHVLSTYIPCVKALGQYVFLAL